MGYKEQKKIEIPVTQPFLPPESEYKKLVDSIWRRNWLTNNGPLVQKLEKELRHYLDLDEIVLVSNGTIALQIAIKALKLKGQIITTPFSYVATTSSIIWEGNQPVFVDIDTDTWNIDPSRVEEAITDQTAAILATHVFGNPCDIGELKKIAENHGIRIIYDAAHAFGTSYNGKPLLSFGDVSATSFHATKLFHTVEGGALITGDPALADRFRYMRNFGHDGPYRFNGVGINGKMSEFHAAMGLANLEYFNRILEKRKKLHGMYSRELEPLELSMQKIDSDSSYNHSYFPVLFNSEKELLAVIEKLANHNIQTRRYFYPLLNELDYVDAPENEQLPTAYSISRRILCLPLYHELKVEEVKMICNHIEDALSQ